MIGVLIFYFETPFLSIPNCIFFAVSEFCKFKLQCQIVVRFTSPKERARNLYILAVLNAKEQNLQFEFFTSQ